MATGDIIDIKKFSDAMVKTLTQELLALGLEIHGQIQRVTPIATNALAGSFVTMAIPAESAVRVTVGSPLWGSAGYGAYVEFGTRAHWAPIQPLISYVREKFKHTMMFSDEKFGRTKLGKRGRPESEIERIAYAIRAKIAREGTRSKKYVAQALSSMGLTFEAIETGTDMMYQINVKTFLEERGVWGKVIARAKVVD